MDSFALKTMILQVLALASMFLGRIPRVGPVIALLTQLINDHWPEVFLLMRRPDGKLTPVSRLASKAHAEAEAPLHGASTLVLDAMQEIERNTNPVGEVGSGESAA